MHHAPFVHLHCHTYYSLLDGALPIEALAARAKALKMPALAMTDHGNLFGAVEFYETMGEAGVKPIIGCEVYLLTRAKLTERSVLREGAGSLSHLTLLARNYAGYQNLCKLSSIAHLDGFYYKPRIDKETLAAHAGGLIALSGCLRGEVPGLLARGEAEAARIAAEWYARLFGEGCFYLELMRHGLEDQAKVNAGLLDLARQCGLPVVATNDCHYLEQAHAAAHDALLCIQTGKTIADAQRMRMQSDQFYLRTPDEMAALFADVPEALANTVAVAEACNVDLDFTTYHFPRFEVPADKDLPTVLREHAQAGLAERWPLIRARREGRTEAECQAEYQTRLEQELATICRMGFAGYFLIVADFIQYAKREGIAVGPGRGSAAGSLVAYCLQITDIDPIPYGLFFERFLNPERISMPDMDIDFCMRRRDEVIQYVAKKYGNVSQIITFGKMKAKAVVRDVGRVLGMPYGDVDRIAKLIPNTLGITLDQALHVGPKLQEIATQDKQVRRLMDIAQTLEGFPRHASTHAAGVVISDQPLVNFLPLYRGQREELTTQFDMKAVEKIGLIKFDFLGLKTLTVLQDTMKTVAARHGVALRLEALPLGDAGVFEMLSRGDTAGIFQLESGGMTDLVTRLKPSGFEDIVALVALFRPGPLGSGMVDDFINRKHGRTAIQYELPQLEPILRETYGVIVYQEQVMQIASALAHYTMGEADLLRRAMGKKKPEEMAQQKKRFMEGCTENNISPRRGERIFDLMEKFAGYGFNKSHSVAYAMIAYQTAYCKCHYPTEYLAALLTCEMGDTDKILVYLNDAKAHGIAILPPDVNESVADFSVVGEEAIRFGLAAVKNVGEGAIASIREARTTDGPFRSFDDFCGRVDGRRVNRRVVESLIKCGAFDRLGGHRAQYWAALDAVLDRAASRQRDHQSGQGNLFDALAPEAAPPTALPEVPSWTEQETLSGEKEALGFYITGHPLAQWEQLMKQYATHDVEGVKGAGDRREVRFGGVSAGLREITTKRGDRMAFVMVEDLRGRIEVVVFADVYQAAREIVKGDQPYCVIGTTDAGEESTKVIAKEILLIEDLPERLTKGVHFHLSAIEADPRHLQQLKVLLGRFTGSCPSYLHVVVPNQSETVMAMPREWHLKPSAEMIRAVRQLFGRDVTQFES
ncbi:MAG: DNA polymerase III subunit alpha [Deltaproteobacteria bacterium]|nr:DNA polymerase III subunit alpha [Deltaproteobacteria bacterium]